MLFYCTNHSQGVNQGGKGKESHCHHRFYDCCLLVVFLQRKTLTVYMSSYHRHLIKTDCLMARTACLVGLVSTVSGCHINTLWKASASNGHKTKQAGQQGRQADQAGRLTGQSGMPYLFQLPCFVLCPLLVPLICWSVWFTNKYVLSSLLFLDIYGLKNHPDWAVCFAFKFEFCH